MNNKGFLEAQKIEPSLKGFVWPETMDIATISNLHFHDHAVAKRELIELLQKSIDAGTVDFDHIHIHASMERPSNVAVSYGLSGPGMEILTGHLREMQRQNDGRILDAHEPADGWVKLLQGTPLYGVANLAGHRCGCKAECTVRFTFANGMPKHWSVQVFHDDGSLALIRLSYRAVPLLTASQYLAFCTKNAIPYRENMPLAGWLGDAESESKSKSKSKSKRSPAKGNPTCGGKAIHKLIDRAFYLVVETKNASDIKPSDVMDAIKGERQKGQLLNIDADAIISSIVQDEKNGGFQIQWTTTTRKGSGPFSYRAFTDCVNKLKKAAIAG